MPKNNCFLIKAACALYLLFVCVNIFGQNTGDFKVREDIQGVLTLYDYTGNQTKVTIPENINDAAVIEIIGGVFTGAFDGKNLTGIVIPDTVKKIGSNAFINNSLVAITLGSDVELSGAFDNDFEKFYLQKGRKKGTYIKKDGLWIVQAAPPARNARTTASWPFAAAA